MTWQELSRPLVSGMPVWPGDAPVVIERGQSIEAGDMTNLTQFATSAHAGTHVDAPNHFVADGGGIETIPLDALIGPALLADAGDVEGHIGARELAALDIPVGTERLLLRTKGGDLWAAGAFSPAYPGISADGARWLIDRRIRLVGVDYMSVAPRDDPAPTHLLLLGEGVVVVEGLELSALQPGLHELIVLPLLLFGSDGAPARAVARPLTSEE